MAVSVSRVRGIALALGQVSEVPHFDRVAFRTARKTFATLAGDGRDLNLMFDPELRDFYCEMAPEVLVPAAGGWGRMGVTRCDLGLVDEATLGSALRAAYLLALPRVKRRSR